MATNAQEKSVDDSSPALVIVPRKRRSTQDLRRLRSAWPEVIARIREADQRLLLLDFDGTLVGLRRHPDDVRFSERGRKILRQLVGHNPRDHIRAVAGVGPGFRRDDILGRRKHAEERGQSGFRPTIASSIRHSAPSG